MDKNAPYCVGHSALQFSGK